MIEQKNASETVNKKTEIDPENDEKCSSDPADDKKINTNKDDLCESRYNSAKDRLNSQPSGFPLFSAEHPPQYFRIMYDALWRNEGSEDGALVFTDEEIKLLLADPVFCYYEKETADALRRLFDTEENTA